MSEDDVDNDAATASTSSSGERASPVDADATELLGVDHLKDIARRAQQRAQEDLVAEHDPDKTEELDVASFIKTPPPSPRRPQTSATRAPPSEHDSASPPASGPSWLASSRPVDLGRPREGTPRVIEGERRAIADLRLPQTQREDVTEPQPPRGRSRWSMAGAVFLLVGGSVMALALGPLDRLMGAPNETSSTPDPKAASIDASQTAPRSPMRLWVKPSVDNELGLAFITPLVDALAAQGWSAAILTSSDAAPDETDPLLEVLPPLVEPRGDDNRRRLHLECWLRSREPDEMKVGLEFAGTAAVSLAAAEGAATKAMVAARAKGLRQCAQRVARQWAVHRAPAQ